MSKLLFATSASTLTYVHLALKKQNKTPKINYGLNPAPDLRRFADITVGRRRFNTEMSGLDCSVRTVDG